MSLRNFAYRLLRRSESVTGTDNVYLVKGGFWLTFGQLVASASSLALAILFGRLVSKEAYGTYQYLLSWGSVLSIASLTGMSDALTQSVARGFDRTVYRVVRTRIVTGLIGFAIALTVGGWEGWRGRPDLFLGFAIVGLLFPLNAALSAWSDYLIGQKVFGLQTRLYLIGTLLAPAALVAAILLAPKPLVFVGAYCLAWTVAQAIGLWYTLTHVRPKGGDDPSVTAYGLKLTALDVIGNVATYFDRLVIFALLGAAPTAAYAFAIAPVEQLKGYLKNLYVMALPKVSARPLSEIRKTFFNKFWLMTGVVTVGIALYVALAPFLYHLLFPAYPEAVRLTQVYAIGLFGTAVALVVAVWNGHKRTKENLQFQVSTSILGIVLLAVFVPMWGLMGAVVARVLTRIIGLFLSVILLNKVFAETKE